MYHSSKSNKVFNERVLRHGQAYLSSRREGSMSREESVKGKQLFHNTVTLTSLHL